MKIWGRLGVNFDINEEELKVLTSGNYEEIQSVMENIIRTKRFEVAGNCYIPAISENDASGITEDIDFEIYE